MSARFDTAGRLFHSPADIVASLMRGLATRTPERLKRGYADLRHLSAWRRLPVARVTRAYIAANGLVVQAGPFAGMRYPRYAVGRAELLVPKLLGAYEQELHGELQAVPAARFDTIVDIGASDGYYAVGFALKGPDSRVVAYEMNPFPARVCRALAVENGVAARVDLRGECRPQDLLELPQGSLFVLCDAEGAERELMDPERAPRLRDASAIVELHEFASPGVTEEISRRFAGTHDVRILHSGSRYIADYPALMSVPDVGYMDREMAVSEFRHSRISWAVLTPRRSG
jgi:hypothetical protein